MTTRTWTGGTGSYSVAANWSGGSVPGPGDAAIFASGTLQIGAVTIDASTTLLVSNGDYVTELHVALTGTTLNGLIHTDLLSAASNGDAEAYDLAGTVTLNGTIAGNQAYGLMDFNDLAAPATLLVGAGGVISDTSADLNLAVTNLVDDGRISILGNAVAFVTSQTVTGTGTFQLTTRPKAVGGIANFNAIAFQHGVASGLTVAFVGGPGEGELSLGAPSTFAATIAGFNSQTDIRLQNIKADAATFGNGTLTVTNAGALVAKFRLAGTYTNNFVVNDTQHTGDTFHDPNDSFIHFGGVACFAAGTRIRTPAGDVAVESLSVGDAVTLAAGGTAAVRWLGHRRIDCSRHPRPRDVQPVRVAAEAFAPGQPARDLLLSPDHAVFADGVLIPVRYLLNGATVRQEDVASITYYHVELPRHAVLLAEALPAESYLDSGNRAAFANGGASAMLHPDFAARALRIWRRDSCAALALGGAAVAAVRARLAARALALGWRDTGECALQVILDAPGATATPWGEDGIAMLLPAASRRVRVLSRSFVPATRDPAAGDWRRLGAALGVALDGAAPAPSCFVSGWHAPDAGAAWRWTDGDAILALPALDGPARLTLKLMPAAARYWLAPDAAVTAVARAG